MEINLFELKEQNAKKCFDDESYVTMADGSSKALKQVQIGDTVKTLDSNGQLIDTDVVMIMDKSDENCKLIRLLSTSDTSTTFNFIFPLSSTFHEH